MLKIMVFRKGERDTLSLGKERIWVFIMYIQNPNGEHRTVRDTIGSLPEPLMDGSDYPGIPLHRRDKLSDINLNEFEH